MLSATALAEHPRSTELLDQLGPAALMDTVLPVWRKYRLARTDWPLDEQAYALHALMSGFIHTATRTPVPRGVTVDTPGRKVMAAAVTALLGPTNVGPADVRAAAREGIRLVGERRQAVLALITTNQETEKR